MESTGSTARPPNADDVDVVEAVAVDPDGLAAIQVENAELKQQLAAARAPKAARKQPRNEVPDIARGGE